MKVLKQLANGCKVLLIVGTLVGSALTSVEAVNCSIGSGCDCCRDDSCEGYHIDVCVTLKHSCGHHPGTYCNSEGGHIED
jgi:hypothetical protein